MTTAAPTFTDAMRAAGFEPPERIEPGRVTRFPAPGKRPGTDAAWCLLFPDQAGGCFGDWSTGERFTWQAAEPENAAERKRWQAQIQQAQAKAERDRQRQHDEAATRAAKKWDGAAPADADHPYLKAKGIKPHGARQAGDRLLVPVYNAAGEMRSIQAIGQDGKKRFETGGAITGNYFPIAKPDGVILIAEGMATAASLHEATGHAVAVAFNAGNLKPVAEAIRAKLPDIDIIIAADDDRNTDGNPGITKAEDAAQATGAKVATPGQPGDFNDLAKAAGLEAVAERIEPATRPARNPTMTRSLATIEPEPIRWLWPQRIARGKLTVIAGDPKVGKSLITADLTARITSGTAWPDKTGNAPVGNVIFASAEDDPADTIRPRIEAAGGDVGRVFIVDSVSDLDRDGEPFERTFNLKKDAARLASEIEIIGDVAAVIIDPVTAYLGGADSHNNAEIRELLAPLAKIAAEHRTAVIAVSHLNKGSGTNALYRVSGSLAFTAAARACWLVTKDQENEDRRLMIPAGNNIGPDVGGMAYAITAKETSIGPVAILEWEPDAIDIDATEALTPDSDERTEKNEAADWLREILRDGPVKAAEIRKKANADGFAWRTVQRARKQAGVTSERSGFGSGTRWHIRATEPQAERFGMNTEPEEI